MSDSPLSWFILVIIMCIAIGKLVSKINEEEKQRKEQSERYWEEWEREHKR